MAHDTHTTSFAHKELDAFGAKGLARLVKNWEDPFPAPIVDAMALSDGRRIRVVRDDLLRLGTKIRACSALLHGRKDVETLVYVAPRAGWAPISLAAMGQRLNKKVILFCPAAKELSHHQRCAYELGAELRFVRVAAMPVLQGYARQFAEQDQRKMFIPLGLADPVAVAGIAKVAKGLKLRNVKQVWSVISTGVLSRGLQVAWPDADHRAVAVARNIKEGERGIISEIYNHPRRFLQDAQKDERPPFPSVTNYDAKSWVYILAYAEDNAVFWNVAGDIKMKFSRQVPASDRQWGDLSDLRRA